MNSYEAKELAQLRFIEGDFMLDNIARITGKSLRQVQRYVQPLRPFSIRIYNDQKEKMFKEIKSMTENDTSKFDEGFKQPSEFENIDEVNEDLIEKGILYLFKKGMINPQVLSIAVTFLDKKKMLTKKEEMGDVEIPKEELINKMKNDYKVDNNANSK